MSIILEVYDDYCSNEFPNWWVNFVNHLAEKHGSRYSGSIVKSELSSLNIKVDDYFSKLEFETESDKMFFILKWS